MADTGQMPPQAAKRFRQNQQKEARRNLRLTLTELSEIQGNIAQAMNAMDQYQKQLAVRIDRCQRDISRLVGDSAD